MSATRLKDKFQAILLGDYNAGKSSIYYRYKEEVFMSELEDYNFDQTSRTFQRNGREMSLQLWDTSGLERAGDMSSNYFHTADAIILVYSCTDNESLNSLTSRWVKNSIRYCKQNVIFFVVGTKTDDKRNISVTEATVKNFFKESEIKTKRFFRISVKENTNFDSFVNDMVDDLVHTHWNDEERNNEVELNPSNSIKDRYDEPAPQRKCPC